MSATMRIRCFVSLFFLFAIIIFTSNAHAEKITIKLAHMDIEAVITTDSIDPGALSGMQTSAILFKRMVELNSHGKIEVKIYPNMQLGAEMEMFESLKEGIIQMTMSSSSTLASFVPEWMAMEIPYLFENFDIMKMVLEGPIGNEYNEVLKKKLGGIILAWTYYGKIHLANNIRPIKSLKDVKGLKLRVTESPEKVKLIEGMGAQAVPINFAELYTSLQQGVVDGLEQSFSTLDMIKIWEVNKYITTDSHRLGLNPWTINEKFFKSLSKEQRRIIVEAARHAATTFQGQVNLGETLWADDFQKRGMEIYYPTPDEIQPFREAAQKAVIPFARSQAGDQWVDKVMNAAQEATEAYYGICE